MYQLDGVIKHYKWGGKSFIPDLLNIEEPKDQPYAEYWIGSHPDGDASIRNLTPESLRVFVQQHPEKVFSPSYQGDRNELPFLLKILDVKDMLSIQVHPDKETAESGFASEESAGKERGAFDRVYKDENHKPELMVALSDFWLVQGFMQAENIRKTLTANPELKPLISHLDEHGIEGLYRYIMTADQGTINNLLKPLGSRIKPLYEDGKLQKSDINYWSARAFFTFNRKGICDRGILSLYLMNLVHLQRGEGIYQAPGVLHAYMEGQNVECMANSDNVIRGGLTPKHMDVNLLLEIVDFKPEPPQIIRASADEIGLLRYETPASEFNLSVAAPDHSVALPSGVSYLLFCIEGIFELTTDSGVTSLEAGDAFFILADEHASLIPLSGKEGTLFTAQSERISS